MNALGFYFGNPKKHLGLKGMGALITDHTNTPYVTIEREHYARSLTDHWLWGLTIGPGKSSSLSGLARQIEEVSIAILTSETHRHWRSLIMDVTTPHSPLLVVLMAPMAASLRILTVLTHEMSRLPQGLHRVEQKNHLWYRYLLADMERAD